MGDATMNPAHTIVDTIKARWPAAKIRLGTAGQAYVSLCPDRNNDPIDAFVIRGIGGGYNATASYPAQNPSASGRGSNDDPAEAIALAIKQAEDSAKMSLADLSSKARRLLAVPYREPTSTHEGAKTEVVDYLTKRFPGAEVKGGDESALMTIKVDGGAFTLHALFNSWRFGHRGEWFVDVSFGVRGENQITDGPVTVRHFGGTGAHVYGPDLGECVDAALRHFWQGAGAHRRGLDAVAEAFNMMTPVV